MCLFYPEQPELRICFEQTFLDKINQEREYLQTAVDVYSPRELRVHKES